MGTLWTAIRDDPLGAVFWLVVLGVFIWFFGLVAFHFVNEVFIGTFRDSRRRRARLRAESQRVAAMDETEYRRYLDDTKPSYEDLERRLERSEHGRQVLAGIVLLIVIGYVLTRV